VAVSVNERTTLGSSSSAVTSRCSSSSDRSRYTSNPSASAIVAAVAAAKRLHTIRRGARLRAGAAGADAARSTVSRNAGGGSVMLA